MLYFLKHLWRKWFGVRGGEIVISSHPMKAYVEHYDVKALMTVAYDPANDEEKILRGEVESYFD